MLLPEQTHSLSSPLNVPDGRWHLTRIVRFLSLTITLRHVDRPWFSEPGVQFYTANFFDGTGSRKPIHGWSGRDGDGYGPHSRFHSCSLYLSDTRDPAFAFLEFHEVIILSCLSDSI
jgi:hypothetical protein